MKQRKEKQVSMKHQLGLKKRTCLAEIQSTCCSLLVLLCECTGEPSEVFAADEVQRSDCAGQSLCRGEGCTFIHTTSGTQSVLQFYVFQGRESKLACASPSGDDVIPGLQQPLLRLDTFQFTNLEKRTEQTETKNAYSRSPKIE